MSTRGRRPLLAVATVLVLAAVAVVAVVVVVRERQPAEPDAGVQGAAAREDLRVPPAGATGASTCTDPENRREWRVQWRTDASGIGVVVTPTGFASRPLGGEWADEGTKTWQLRWNLPALVDRRFGTLMPEKSVNGDILRLTTERIPARLSPRYVTPDGTCSVFATPYTWGGLSRPQVSVIGDSLVAQLGPDAEDLEGPSLVTERLLAAGRSVEVNGQGGRRWTRPPEAQAGDVSWGDTALIDEIRGLRGGTAQVIALGTNDAGWVSMAANRQDFDLRLAWVLVQLTAILDEVEASGQCTVLVTAEDRKVSYLGNDEARFAEAAQELNDALRERAGKSPDDDVHVSDWAAASADHHTGDDDPWFGEDTIHLNGTGRAEYADHLARAAAACGDGG
jgi:lysophospholipase L1-like esterase